LAAFSGLGGSLLKIIVGLESLPSPSLLADTLQLVGQDRCIFSLDLKGGMPITQVAAWRDLTPAEIAGEAIKIGIRTLVVLDLADVGGNQGTTTTDLCAGLRRNHPHVRLFAGGGVRSMADVQTLGRSGCNGVLVASALHDGHLTVADLAAIGALT
jgi:phosphoribosylformimino-5-aminoimidazole carboxamide ribotide isomerase